MIAQWYVEAGKYDVLPIDGSAVQRLMTERPQIAEARTSYIFWPGTQSVPFSAGPRVLNRPHAITADVDIPPGGAEGVLLCQGASIGGCRSTSRTAGCTTPTTTSAAPSTRSPRPTRCPRGGIELRFEFEPTGEPDIPQGKGTPAGPSSTSTASSSAQADFPVTTPIAVQPGRPGLRRQPRLARHPGLPGRRSASPARCTPSPSTCAATSSPTPKAKCGWPWHANSRAGRAALVRSESAPRPSFR